jgi:hypothetical protein
MGALKTHKILVLKINVKYRLRGLNVDITMNIEINIIKQSVAM